MSVRGITGAISNRERMSGLDAWHAFEGRRIERHRLEVAGCPAGIGRPDVIDPNGQRQAPARGQQECPPGNWLLSAGVMLTRDVTVQQLHLIDEVGALTEAEAARAVDCVGALQGVPDTDLKGCVAFFLPRRVDPDNQFNGREELLVVRASIAC